MARSPMPPMIRRCPFVLFAFALAAFAFTVAAPAQEMTREQFRNDFNKGLELKDDKLMDRATKRGPLQAIAYLEELVFEALRQAPGAEEKCQALAASWQRTFESSEAPEKTRRWVELSGAQLWNDLQQLRAQSAKRWSDYQAIANDLKKPEFEAVFRDFQKLARSAEQLGHFRESAEAWNLAAVVGSKMPEKSLDDRREVLDVTEQFLTARRQWGLVFDEHYLRSIEFVKYEKERVAEAAKQADQRAAEGYSADSKGVDSLVMPNVEPTRFALKFAPLANWSELDYGPKNGPVPAFWWMASLGEEGSMRKLDWFREKDVFLHRTGATKFAIGLDPASAASAVPVDVSSKPKPSTFWLDADKQVPYAMFFWVGTDRELVNEAECNLSTSSTVANLYYRSAASWKGQIGTEPIVVYDDNASGAWGDADPFAGGYKSPMLGDHEGDGTAVPLFDSMRVGKGERTPHSEFVKLATGWHHMAKVGDSVSLRPLNPEYFKTGKVKLAWNGPKPSAPAQLVVQGSGDYRTAVFDIAGGKEVELPAGEYRVIFGRIVAGKGARVQLATIYPGADAKPFVVEPGKTAQLVMGAPFRLAFERVGDQNTTIDALKVHVVDASGCMFTEFHGSSLACDVMAAKDDSGKGQKPVGEFVRFTDPELVNKAAAHHNRMMQLTACFPMPQDYREGALLMTLKLPEAGLKLQLQAKKHPLFGALESPWQ